MEMDNISCLPVEIALKIFGNLSPEDLGRCSLVSRRWYLLTNLDSLWKRFSDDEEYSVPPKIKKKSKQFSLHKAWYARRALSIKRWVNRTYWIHYCRPNSCNALMANGAILVEAYDNRIWVTDMNNGKAYLQRIAPEAPPSLSVDHTCSVWFSQTLLVMQIKWSGYLAVYKWINKKLIFLDVVYGKYNNWGDVFLDSFKLSGQPQSQVTLVFCWSRILVESDHLIIAQGKTSIYIWSLEKSRCTARLLDFDIKGFCNLFTNEGLLYACCYKAMLVYDLSGNLKKRVHYDIEHVTIYDCFLFFNKTVILAAFTGQAPMHAAWDLELNVVATPFDVDGVGFLHPSLPAICFMENDETEVLAKKFVAMDIRTKTVLWRSESFHCSRISTKFIPRCNYVILSDKYVVYFCSTEFSEPGCFRSWFLLDLDKGEIVTRCVLPFQTQIRRPKYCGNKAVIYDTTDDSNMCFVFT